MTLTLEYLLDFDIGFGKGIFLARSMMQSLGKFVWKTRFQYANSLHVILKSMVQEPDGKVYDGDVIVSNDPYS